MSKVVKIGVLVLQDEDDGDKLLEPDLSMSYTSFFRWLNELGGIRLGGIAYAVELLSVYSRLSTVDQQMDFLHSKLGVDLVLGPSDDRAVEAVARAADASGMLFIAAGPASGGVLSSSPWTFSVQPPPAERLTPGLQAVAKAGALSLAVLYEDTPVSQEVCGTVDAFARQYNLRIILERSLPVTGPSTTFSSIVALLQLSQVDVVVGCLGGTACQSLLTISRTMDYNPQAFLFTECAVNLPPRRELGSLGLFLVGSVPLAPDLAALDAEAVEDDVAVVPLKAYTLAANQEEKEHHVFRQTSFGLFTAYALVCGVQASGSTIPADVAAALSNMNFDGAGQLRSAQSEVVQSQMDGSVEAIAGKLPLTYPRPSWNDLRCSNRKDVEEGRLGVDTVTDECRVCHAGEAPHFPEDASRSYCKSCPAGKHLEGVSDSGLRICVPCALGTFGADAGREVCSMCPMGTYQDQTGQTACRLCLAGSYAQHEASDACTACSSIGGVSSYADKHGSTSCKSCTTGSHCSPTSVTNAEGYHRHVDGNTFRCIHGGGAACAQNHSCHRDGKAGEETMEGFLCGVCRPGYSRTDPLDLCEPCMAMAPAFFWCFLSALLPHLQVVIICVAVVYTDFTKPKNQALIIFKITFNYVQMCTVVMPLITLFEKFDFFNPFWLNTGLMSIIDPPSAGPAFQCILWKFMPSTKPHRLLLVLAWLWIPLWVFLPTAVYFMVWFIRRRHYKSTRCLEKVVIFAVVSLYFIHPRVSNIFISQLSCRSFDELRLVSDTNVLCSSAENQNWMGLSMLGLVVFSFGTPLCLGGMLTYLKHNARLKDLQVLRMLGFLYAGLEPQCYYYECVLMLRKVMLPMAAVLPLQNGRIILSDADSQESLYLCSVVALLFVTTVFLAVHMKLNPFDNRSYFILDRIEMLSLCSILTLLLAQTFSTIIHPEAVVSLVIAVLVTVVYVGFISILLWGLCLRQFFNRFPRLMSKLQSCNSPWVTVQPDGFGSLRMHGTVLSAFTCIFTEVISDHTEYLNYLSYHSLTAFIQRVCVTAYTLRMRKDKHGLVHAASPFLKPMERIASVSFKQNIESTLEKGENRLRSILGWNSSGSRTPNIDESAVTMQMLYGEAFTVEELHEAMVWCQRSLCEGQSARLGTETPKDASGRTISVSSESLDLSPAAPSMLTDIEWDAIDIALGPEACYTSGRSEDGVVPITLSRDVSMDGLRSPTSPAGRLAQELPSEARHFPVAGSPRSGAKKEELPSEARHFSVSPRASPVAGQGGRLFQSMATYTSEDPPSVVSSRTVEEPPTPSGTVASSRTEATVAGKSTLRSEGRNTSKGSARHSQRMLLSVNMGIAPPRRPSALSDLRSSIDFVPWRSERTKAREAEPGG